MPALDDTLDTQQRILCHVGQSGSGKTHALEEDTLERAEHRRVFVLDSKREWSAIPGDERVCAPCLEPWRRAKCELGSDCVVQAEPEKAFRRFEKYGFAVLRPARSMRIGPRLGDHIPLIEYVAKWSLDTGDLDLVIPEAHMHFPLNRDGAMGEQCEQLITQFRSYGISIACDTQQFASLSMKLRKQVNVWRFFGMSEGTPDIEQVRKLGGDSLAAAVLTCAERHSKDAPGWHVQIDPRTPPSNKPKLLRY